MDDEDPLRQAISKILRKQGLSVIEATDGSGALDVIRTEKVHLDLLLLDVTLPPASSREIYEEAKCLRPGLPVIVASAKTEEMAAAALATRMNRFLRKPYRLVELLERDSGRLTSGISPRPCDRLPQTGIVAAAGCPRIGHTTRVLL